MGKMLEAALGYTTLGYPVFPCIPDGKRPITKHGFKDASLDPETIREWWTRTPTANVAMPTNGLIVVDIDGKDNPWLNQRKDLGRGPMSKTPGGGRHYFFRQPAGKFWRSTAGDIAPKVDTRGNGGYVLLPPSIVGGRPYEWGPGLKLAKAVAAVPTPLEWLIKALDSISQSLTALPAPLSISNESNTIPAGERNSTLTSLGGSMRRAGMDEAAIMVALEQTNRDRCQPPIASAEVEKIARSVSRYRPNGKAIASAEGIPVTGKPYFDNVLSALEQERESLSIHPPKSLGQIVKEYPALRNPVIHGLLREGETMNIVSASKMGKSWLTVDLALAVATGRPWLGMDCELGEVLILDNELHPETSANRFPKVAAARGIDPANVQNRIHIESLRGQLKDLHGLVPYFTQFKSGRFKVIILDAFYRFLPPRCDENDNAMMAKLYNLIDSMADRLQCCFAIIHHSCKGLQSEKDVTDVGAGAGSQSRATDTHLIMRHHEQASVVVLEAAVRSWPPVPSQCLRWAFPVWEPAPELDPLDLRRPKQRNHKRSDEGNEQEKTNWTKEMIVQKLLSNHPKTRAEFLLEVDNFEDLTINKAWTLLQTAEAAGMAYRWDLGRNKPGFATVPQKEARSKEGNKK